MNEINEIIKSFYLANSGDVSFETLQRMGKLGAFISDVQSIAPYIITEQSTVIKKDIVQSYRLGYQALTENINKYTSRPVTTTGAAGLYLHKHEIIGLANPFAPGKISAALQLQIQDQITLGVMSGDSYRQMASRLSDTLNYPYQNAIRTARTETHRARNAGAQEAAERATSTLAGVASMGKVWRTMADARVRRPPKSRKANHDALEGQTVGVNDYFDLGNGIRCKTPGTSGDAENDINCRCYAEYSVNIDD